LAVKQIDNRFRLFAKENSARFIEIEEGPRWLFVHTKVIIKRPVPSLEWQA
jgi:hypothetical protein